jgi:PIN domain nuclease of toxin-antitoxin system
LVRVLERGGKFIMVFLDTHIMVWLYQRSLELLSERARLEIETNDIFISPIVKLELEYLYEIERIRDDSQAIIDYLKNKIALKTDDSNFLEIINIAVNEKWTRDPFDRLIVAHSKYKDAYLITKDERVKTNYFKAIF